MIFSGDTRNSNFQVDFLFKKKKKKLGIYFKFEKKVKVAQYTSAAGFGLRAAGLRSSP